MNLFHKTAFNNRFAVDYSLRNEQQTFSSKLVQDELLNHNRYSKCPSG
jgi:hypothetical protein